MSGRTRLTPEALLAVAKALELEAGRRRAPRGGPRLLDIDLLLFGDIERRDPELTLPHPALAHRRFALAPLAELRPRHTVPGTGRTVGELLAAVGQEDEVERVYAGDGWLRGAPPLS